MRTPRTFLLLLSTAALALSPAQATTTLAVAPTETTTTPAISAAETPAAPTVSPAEPTPSASASNGAVSSPARAMQNTRLVDRIAAIVNGEVITLAQVNRAVQLQETELARSTDNCTAAPGARPDAETRMLQCMIDRLLMFQHVRRFPQFDVVADDIEAQYQRLVEQFGSRQVFEEELRRMELTPDEVRYDLERQALIGNYIDLRYRDVLDIGETAQRRYYEGVLRAEMERQGAPIPPFEAVDDELIEPILVETEVNRRVDEWVADLRRRGDITVFLW